MHIRTYILALAPLALFGCAAEQPVATTTTVTREVTTTGPANADVVVAQPPQAVRVETQTVAPGAGYVWTNGYWQWTGTSYVWVSGRWISRPRPAAVWVEGHWIRRPGGWVWVRGHWR